MRTPSSGFHPAGLTPGAATREGTGWAAMLLPFIEQGNLHNQLRISQSNLVESLLSTNWQLLVNGLQTPIPSYMCPSDSGFAGNGLVHNDRRFNGAAGFAAHAFTPAGQQLHGATGYGTGRQNAEENTGIFYGNSGVRFGDIPDGTSNTFLVGERDTKNCRSGTWVGVRNTNGAGSRGIFVVIAHSRAPLNEPVLAWDSDPEGVGKALVACIQAVLNSYPAMAPFGLCLLIFNTTIRVVVGPMRAIF